MVLHDLLVVTNLLDKSISELIMYEKHLLKTNSGELSLNHRLAIYLEQNLIDDYKSYNVDCEYFRDYTDFDRKNNRKGSGQVPDIIIHKRGNNFPTNYLYLEAKRFENTKEDIEKINYFLSNSKYKYQFGVYVNYFSSINHISYNLFHIEGVDIIATERYVCK